MATEKKFVASEEAKGKAKQLRAFAILAWIIAIAGEIFAILQLISDEMLTWLIVAIVVILALAVTGNLLWKKANRMDPASEKQKFKFFVQNQLGAIMSVLAFLPLVILIFTNKDADKKTKGIAGAVAVVALLVAGITGVDFDPPSVEKYTERINNQSEIVQELTDGRDHVYWAPTGKVLHIYEDCPHLKNSKNIGSGTVKDAWEARGIDDNRVCRTCAPRAAKERGLDYERIEQKINGDETGQDITTKEIEDLNADTENTAEEIDEE